MTAPSLRRRFLRRTAACTVATVLGPFAVGAGARDGLRWDDLRRTYFPDAPVVPDPRVQVIAPPRAEDALNVPVRVSAVGLQGVESVVVLVDYNPIVKVLEFRPALARPALEFRLKLQAASPVRALARTPDGVWHMGVTEVDAAGGGCTAPSLGRADGSWTARLNRVEGRLFARGSDLRIRMRVLHPMDTGLAPGIPAFYIEALRIADERSRELLTLQLFEPVSENPMFAFDLPTGLGTRQVLVDGRDNNGNRIEGRIGP